MADKGQNPELEKIDERILELIERRIEEKVIQRVEATLMWRYGLAGVAFAFALFIAGLGWNQIITSMVDAKIKEITGQAEEKSERINVTLGIAEELAKQNAEFIASAKKKLAEVGPTIDTINTLETRQKALDDRTKALIVTVGEKPITTLLDENMTRVAALGKQVDRLSQIVEKLPGTSTLTAKDGSTVTKVQTDVANLVRRTDEQVRQSAEAQKMPTVFIQFAGAPREQAKALRTALQAAKYNVPPEDRDGGAAGLHEVRFFNNNDNKDASAAGKLAKDTTNALKQLGYKNLTVQTADFTNFSGVKPQPGVLELWIELPKLPPKS
ncbi:MAG: hypothetical protein ACK47N_21705 [Microcystis sp.]|jgi:hypothetical protein|uniref:Uncharacterized protein n=1 Tax=Microcystis viridis NIES-102 TaxID=213615 RepID=A0A3G9JE61_MICVR|nr:hypothetical protein [Microcystis viridis]BBH38856.1 hypothetical protein myaer102_13720 [Microcystis viridis NIES-102]